MILRLNRKLPPKTNVSQWVRFFKKEAKEPQKDIYNNIK